VEKLSSEQLKHIQGNRDARVARRFPVAVGKVAAEVLKSGSLAGPAWRRRLLAVLEEHAAALLEHASIVGVRHGVLRLHVAEPALMYSLRMTWEQRLLNVLRTELPESGIQALRFMAGANA
jgi:hypothetical protein